MLLSGPETSLGGKDGLYLAVGNRGAWPLSSDSRSGDQDFFY